MIEKAKKVYEAPSMKVYEIGRSQILAGSTAGGSTNPFGEDPEYNNWQ